MKTGNKMIFQLNKARFFLWYMGGLELYNPTENQLKVWLDGCKN